MMMVALTIVRARLYCNSVACLMMMVTSSSYLLLPYYEVNIIIIIIIIIIAGSCAEVMDEGMFVHSIDFILKGLQQKEISSAASMSLKDLLLANKERIGMVSKDVLRGLQVSEQWWWWWGQIFNIDCSTGSNWERRHGGLWDNIWNNNI